QYALVEGDGLLLLPRGHGQEDVVEPEHGHSPGRSASTRAVTADTTSSRATSSVVRPFRVVSSTTPEAAPLGPTVIRKGMPTSSASANLTPGRSSRSSRITSTPAALSSS